MPPKRRDRENENKIQQQLRMEQQMPTDHELFLQAFEKPTQIYRYLRTRSIISPCFLMRTLSYMKHRMSRRHNKRKDFKIDSFLERLMPKNLKKNCEPLESSSYLNITFTGFFDKLYRGASGTESVLVETILLKFYHKKRKDVMPPVMQATIGQSLVIRNPDGCNMPTSTSAISIPASSFHFNNNLLVKSHVLLFRVTIMPQVVTANGTCNGRLGDSDEPPAKRHTSNGRTACVEEEKLYGAELIVFDKHQACLLTSGDYELVLQEVVISKSSPKKYSTWESFDDNDKTLEQFDVFNWGPTLRFSLGWSSASMNGMVPMPTPILSKDPPASQVNGHDADAKAPGAVTNGRPETGHAESTEKRKKPKIFYQFLYNNNTRQQTEAREDLQCPWCALNCSRLYSLLKHLKLSHSRFSFTYIPHPKGARIDVSINECYDGSYAGNPHDLLSCPPGLAFSRNGPVRRTPVTTVTVCHPQRLPPSLSEFLEADDSEYDGMRPYVMGHNRLYHHTGTCLPVRPQEIDIDSEAENDPEWLRIKTKHMIDEFTDVNEGEKELMKLWNLHVMKFGFVGNCQIPLACRMFVELHGQQVLQKRLFQNFVLHLCNLQDFGLIGEAALYQAIRQLQAMQGDEDRGATTASAPISLRSARDAVNGSRTDRDGGGRAGTASPRRPFLKMCPSSLGSCLIF